MAGIIEAGPPNLASLDRVRRVPLDGALTFRREALCPHRRGDGQEGDDEGGARDLHRANPHGPNPGRPLLINDGVQCAFGSLALR